jgi:hypothetical protein
MIRSETLEGSSGPEKVFRSRLVQRKLAPGSTEVGRKLAPGLGSAQVWAWALALAQGSVWGSAQGKVWGSAQGKVWGSAQGKVRGSGTATVSGSEQVQELELDWAYSQLRRLRHSRPPARIPPGELLS